MHIVHKKLTSRIAEKERVITIWDIYTKVIRKEETEVKRLERLSNEQKQ